MSTTIPPAPNPSTIPPHYQREADYRRAQQLAKSMLDSGFDKQTAETALAWLDSSKERDLALLQKLTIQKIKNEQELGKAWEQDGNGACDEKKRKE